jgi:hypothetical protein
MDLRVRWSMVLAAVALVTVSEATAFAAAPAKPTAEASRVFSYKQDGATYFALSLLPPSGAAPAAAPSDIVVLFDTSASQTGDYRDKGLSVLRGMLATLGEKDRVQLYSVDVGAVPLTKTFVSPNSAEMNAALAELDRRAPLGSTDMAEALTAAAASFSGDAAAPRAAVYIGDGVNNAGAIADDLRRAMDQLVKARVSVTSYAIGPQINGILLAAAANQTGGMFIVDQQKFSAKDAGAHLSRVAAEPVIWVAQSKLPKGIDEVYPTTMPPLRSDRDTVVIGKGELAESFAVEVQGVAGGKPVALKWNVQTQKDNEENAYLVTLIENARPNGGFGLPTLGTEGLLEARRLIAQGANDLVQLSKQAAASGDKPAARRMAKEALRRDPNNEQAERLSRIAHRDENAPADNKPADGRATPSDGELRLVRRQLTTESPAEPLPPEPIAREPLPADNFLDDVVRQRALLEQVISQEVRTELSRARGRLGNDPASVETDLKVLLERVDQTPEIRADVRGQLREQLLSAIREAARRKAVFETEQIEALDRLQVAEETRRLQNQLIGREQRVAQLIERMNGLLDEGRYQDAELDAARPALEILPDSPVTSNAVLFSRTLGYAALNASIRDRHNRALVNALLSVDEAAIPFPDDPPIVYPPADVWLDLTRRREKYKAVDLSQTGSAEERINRELLKPTELEFTEIPLKEAIDYIKDRHEIEIQFDEKALTEAAVATDTPITKNLQGISLRSALRLILRPLQLTYVIKDEVLLITSQTEAENQLVVKVYPVADLVLPISNGGINPFMMGGVGGGMMGGGMMGGGMGMGGMGMGGMGMGGMGMGGMGGGMGMGGMGGGFGFNVPDRDARAPRFPRPNQKGLIAFDVPDLKLKKKAAEPVADRAATKQTVAVQPPKVQAAPVAETPRAGSLLDSKEADSKPASEKFHIELSIPSDADVYTAWDAYFKSLDERAGIDKITDDAKRHSRVREVDAAIRDAVRRLMKEHKFEHVVALVHAALRNGYAQPWMYEGMGLALQAMNRPKAEIERALMSAVDFAASTDEVMYVAMYMSRIGLDRRAYKLFRQVSAMEPTRHEPYLHGLLIAQRLEDIDAIRWACTGVLGQAWSKDKLEIVQAARHLATSTLESLRKEKREDEAKQFETALNEALSRDLVVRVSWTGDADVDLSVEEPTGTVCSLSNPRTLSGGVLLADDRTGADKENVGYVENYVVPRAFAGDYKILVRRVWGKVAAGKVTVDIVSQYGTMEQKQLRQQIPLGEKDALVNFTLEEGRRKEPLEQAQVAVAAANHREMGKGILAQQLSASSDPNAARDLAVARNLQRRGLPFFRNGAVGYQPVISTLPEGTNMSVTAVVSADRRYVRITPTPLFSTIPQVDTFNFASGQGNQQQQGGGNQFGGGFGGGQF